MTKALPYYSFNKILSHNAVFNFICGARGVGKTYGAKRIIIKDYVRNKKQFIYLRRFGTDLKNIHTFFDDIYTEFPDWELRVKGSQAQARRISSNNDNDWEIMGYFLPLSKSASQKSVSYPNVKWIVFDEFILEQSGFRRYMPSEHVAFMEFYSTVDRYKDKTRVLFLANSVSITNPYFIGWDIRPDECGEFSISHNGFIACHFVESKEFATEVYRTKFGQFIQNTSYAEYSVASKFADADDAMVQIKNGKFGPMFNLQTRTGIISVWLGDGPVYHISENMIRDDRGMVTTEIEFMETGKTLMERNHYMLAELRRCFNSGRMTFDTPRARNTFLDIYRRTR